MKRPTLSVGAYMVVNTFFAICLIGFSCSVLGMIRRGLWEGGSVCWTYSYTYYKCTRYVSGCLISGNDDYLVPCKYAFAVGSLGIFFGLFAICFQCLEVAGAANVVMGVVHTVWWVVAGALFTQWRAEAPTGYPKENDRTALIAVMWSAASISIVMLFMSIPQALMAKKMAQADEGGGEFDAPHGHKHKTTSEAEMGPAAPAPAQAAQPAAY